MGRLHAITNDDKLLQLKVNFFADYFGFAAENIGVFDPVRVENPLSLVDKILFQITKNFDHCPKYLDSYFRDEFLQPNNKYLDDDKRFNQIQKYLAQYRSLNKHKEKLKWLEANSRFIELFQSFRTSLERTMFKKSLKAIISYLKCSHGVDHHKVDTINLSNILISEFVLKDRSKRDINRVFQRILSKEVDEFPFPKSIKTVNEKKHYIENRTFEQQFDAIYNILKEESSKSYFIYRIYGLKVPEDFSFKYNRVTFYHPRHTNFQKIYDDRAEYEAIKDFFGREDLILASTKADYNSIDIGVAQSVEVVTKALRFFNRVNKTICVLEPFSYLLTQDYSEFGWHIDPDSFRDSISEEDLPLYQDHPHHFLRNQPTKLKNSFLKHEPLYVEALTTKNVAAYWQYLENIIPTKANNDKQVIDIVSHLLLLNAQKYRRTILNHYILNLFNPLMTSARSLGMSSQKQLEIFKKGKRRAVNWVNLQSQLKNPLVSHLIDEYSLELKSDDYRSIKLHNEQVLWETQAQRNAIVHQGIAHDKSLIKLTSTLPRLVTRLRWVLFDGMRRKVASTYDEMIAKLKEESSNMI